MTGPALVTGVLAATLAEQRDRCNALIAAARRAHSDLDVEAIADQLRGPVRELVEACEEVAPGSGSPVLAAVFPIVTDLAAQRRLGVGGGHDVLLAALPGLAAHVAAQPRLVVGSLANAVVHLERAEVPVEAWLARLLAVAAAPGPTSTDTASLLAVGQVAAWALGLSAARESALDVAAGLAGPALAAAFATDTSLDPEATVRRLRADRWWRPGAPDRGLAAPDAPDGGPAATRSDGHRGSVASPRIVARVGGFRGFGGPFLAPPVVTARDGRLVVRSGSGTWMVHADAFGAALTRVPDDATLPPPTPIPTGRFPPELEPMSAAVAGDLAACTVASSYEVLVVGPAP